MITCRSLLPVRIDFMPFASVALLIIGFFILQKVTRSPIILGVSIPSGCRKYVSASPPKKVVVLFLLPNNRIGVMQYWHGDDMVELHQTDFGPNGLTSLLKILKKSDSGDVAVVMKPNQLATLRNVDNALKELKREGVPYLPVSELTSFEQRRLRYYEQMFVYQRIGRDTVFLQLQPYYCSLEGD